MILGNAVAGVVESLGPGVEGVDVGARVVSSTGGSGGYAERVAADADNVVAVPGELGLPEAVALLADGRTALALMGAAKLDDGERVLVTAAGGGLGSLLVQLARAAGAGQVVAAAGGERKLALARELGADVALAYRSPDWPDRLRDATDGGVDVAFDGVGGAVGRAAFELTAPGGRCLIFGYASGSPTEASLAEVLARGLIVIGGGPMRSAQDIGQLASRALEEAEAGRLRPVIGQTFPLGEAAEAHAAMEARATVGKTLLVC